MHRETVAVKAGRGCGACGFIRDLNIDEVVDAIDKNYAKRYREYECNRLAKSAGFCFGVKRAVDMVYEQD